MRVQLSEKSKAEFIELINKDSITCWFEGDEFVMPSGQGKTAKGIVLGKLLVWQHRQTKVDELQKQLIDQGQRFNEQAQRVKDLEHKNNELQKRVDAALQEIKGAARWIEEDAVGGPEFIKGGALRALKRLEQALKGDQ